MIKKRETCLYCGEKMESKSAKKKFCSPLHKLYWHREKERGTLEPSQLEEAKDKKEEKLGTPVPKEIPIKKEPKTEIEQYWQQRFKKKLS